MNIRTFIFVFFACLALVSKPGLGQETLRVPIGGEPLVHVKDGAVQGCGLRFSGGQPRASAASTWFDVSLNVYRHGLALVHTIGYEIAQARYDAESRPERVSLQRAWLRVDEAVGNTRLGENTEVRDSVIYAITLEETRDLFEGVATGQPLMIGMKGWGRRADVVYVGAVNLNEDKREALAACLEELLH